WQKHNAPKPPTPAVSTAGVPSPASPLAAPGSAPTAAAPMPSPIASPGAPPAVAGEPVIVATDLFEVEIGTAGGDIRRVTMKKVFSALDRNSPLTLLEPNSKHYFVTQSGLLGEGLPNHKTLYQAEGRAFTLASGPETLEVRLKARDGATDVVKRFLFRRGSYEIVVSYDITNTSDKPIA